MGNFTNSSSLIQEIEGKQKRIVQSATTPATPQSGDYWFDTTNLVLKHYNGTAREIVGANVRVITQEDYDDLTPAEKQNGTLYLITGDSEELTIKWANITDKPNFATVATSGSYNDLTNKPTIPSSLGDLSGNSDNITEGSTHKFITTAEKSKISTAVQPGDLAAVATSGSYNDLSNIPTIPSALGDLTGTSDNITEGTTHKFVTTAEKDKISTAIQPGDLATVATSGNYNDLINLPSIPVDADDVNALPDTTKYGASLSMTMDTSTFIVTVQLKDQDGNNLGTSQTIDLPLESVVVSGSYDNATKKVILTLKDGSTVDFSVADLISGLQSEITSTNKLNADLVDDTNSAHKFVSATEKSTWNGKQAALTTAQLNAVNSGITSAKVSTYDGYATTIAGKQAALDSNQLAAVNSGITATKVGTYDGYATSKQNKLTTQTAYTQKGSATKVPQITTNTLGQVTEITEVTITQPDISGKADKAEVLTKTNITAFTPTGDYQPATKKYVDDNAGGEQNLFIITEDMVTVTTSENMGVAPYSTSYKYTNFDINANAGIEWKEGAIYTFVVDTKMVVASAYRNVRVRIGSGAYIPVMGTTAAIAGNSYFTKTNIRQFQYTTKYESGGALHLFTDSNTTYKAMTAEQATAGTATTALTITPAVLKGAITTHAPVKSVNGATGAVTGLQTTANLKTNLTDNSDSYYPSQKAVKTAVDAKQATLVSGTNIKTINNESLLGSGNISIAAGGDMNYADYNWSATTGATVTLSLNTEHTPNANFTVNAPATIKDGQTYILRVANGATAYTMTLGTNITNPYSTSTTLTANGIDQFVFVAKGGSLELQPEIQGGGSGGGTRGSITGTLSNQTDLNTALTAKADASSVLTKTNTTSYTPTANYHPATKKYVDDKIATALVNNTTGTTSSVKQLRVGTQAEYNALSSYDDTILYFTTDSN